MSSEVSKNVLRLAVAGGMAFWVANFLTSLTPIAAEYRADLSISYLPMLVESLLGGLVIGFCVSYFLTRSFDKIPAENPVLKSVIISFIALAIIEAFAMLVNLNQDPADLLTGAVLNLPRFLALGTVVGYLYRD
jgi:flagellar biosynthesis protein FliR